MGEGGLDGLRVLLTRPAGRGAALARRLQSLGARVEFRPTIAFAPAADGRGAIEAVNGLEGFDWLVFTSPTGVEFFARLLDQRRGAGAVAPGSIAAIGPATGRALEARGMSPRLVAEDSRSEGLAAALGERMAPGQRVLVIRPEVARTVVYETLSALGAAVTEAVFYRTVPADGVAEVAREVRRGAFDLVVFTSPSTFRHLLDAEPENAAASLSALRRVPVVAIGGVTAESLRCGGLQPASIARAPSEEALFDALCAAAALWYHPPLRSGSGPAQHQQEASLEEAGQLRQTPLHGAHLAANARMVDFTGWHMPVQYSGVIDEHLAVRNRVGLFDVSHMGEATVRGRQALDLLQYITCNDVSRLKPGRAHYTALTTEAGTPVDDLLIYMLDEGHYLLVLNAANVDKDVAWLERHASRFDVELRDESAGWAQLAVQGPRAAETLRPLTSRPIDELRYYRFVRCDVEGVPCIVSRTGYTGEDGFEVYGPPAEAPRLWHAILGSGARHGIVPVGLGARDTLRLEARMALYGSDIDETTTLIEADLGWIVKPGKGDFLGREVLARQLEHGVERRLVGFEMRGRAIARHSYAARHAGREVGRVTSGSHAPFLKKNIGLAYLPVELTEPGTEFEVEVRRREEPAVVVATPFYKRPR